MAAVQLESISFEHHPTGFGIGHRKPRISWRFSSDNTIKSWKQESYTIQVGRQNNQDPEVYNVQSKDSVLVPWPSKALESRESAWVKIQAYGKGIDASGNSVSHSTDLSKAATVEAALFEKGDWTARMTAAATKADAKAPKRPILFRKAFSMAQTGSQIGKARLYITAHGVYKAYLNGTRIGSDEMAPGWTSYNHRLLYQSFDVTEALRTDGSNIMGVEVAEGWFAGRLGWEHRRCCYGERLAFLAQLEVLFDNGSTFTLCSDGTWKCSPSPITRSEIYDGEDYDSRQEQVCWMTDAGFNEDDWKPTEEIEFPSALLIPADSPSVRVLEEIKPVKIFKSRSGKALVDFGQNLVGKLQIRLPNPGAKPGHMLTFSHAEVLEQDELGIRPLRDAKPVDSVILSKSQPEIWSPKFTFHGFRYVQVDGWPTEDSMPSISDITALVMHSDMGRTGWFSCSEPMVNQLHENVIWSLKGNFFSIPTDCPQRDERLGWTGDIQVFTPSASFLYNVNSFLGSWLDDVSDEQLEEKANGVPGLVVPNIFDKPNPPGPQCVWHDVTVLTPWDLYTSSGDAGLLRRQYPSMKAWVNRGIPRGENGLWDQNIWQYGDWLDPSAPPDQPGKGSTDSHLIADAYLVHVLETISKVCSVLGEAEDANRYSEDARRTRKMFQDEYTTSSGLIVGDTATAYSLAIVFGLLDGEQRIKKAGNRLSHLAYATDYRISTGFVGTPLITHALSASRNHQVAYRMLLEKSCPSWLYPITMGATTVWERWDSMLPDGSINPGSMTSFNHYALGSVVNWMHKTVGGISPLDPGWKRILVQPVPGGTLKNAEVKYESPYGQVAAAWKIDADGNFNLSVTIPPNCSAVVVLPSKQQNHSGENIGSGVYSFSCPYEPEDWPPKPEFERSTFRLEG
ncbi:hypothetical protein VHEMI01658 [[Torrubiella] hemipterigena]|uniref:alpha-L-rhamnosidase n=1 Tax=[Torrubiella] hemipterigena TaxID=1531966 RepID=A0A0A1T5F9_9HYPO|nr:hypothetical protein VHEMI01658 [[Torrubiella] hemipterigena]